MPQSDYIEAAFRHASEVEAILYELMDNLDDADSDNADLTLLTGQAARLALDLEDMLND